MQGGAFITIPKIFGTLEELRKIIRYGSYNSDGLILSTRPLIDKILMQARGSLDQIPQIKIPGGMQWWAVFSALRSSYCKCELWKDCENLSFAAFLVIEKSKELVT